MKIIFFCIIMCLQLITFCSSGLPRDSKLQCEKIRGVVGPEDFAYAQIAGKDLLLISSHERRDWTVPGEIFKFAPSLNQLKKMARIGEPADLVFAPHGIDIRSIGSQQLLYVVSHGKEMNDENQNIIVYQIKPEQLEYMGHVRDEKIVSPNDVIITAKGDFYITNDARDRGSLWDIYWRREISTVVFCNLEIDSEKISKKFCKVAAENLALPNSLAIQGNKMYVSTTRQNKIFEYDIEAGGELSNQRAVAEGVGFDNLSWSNIETGSGMLLTAEHASDWKFFRHVSSSENIAPSLVSMIDITTSEKKVLYANEGSEISAASGAIIFKNILYISQVFDDFILACKL